MIVDVVMPKLGESIVEATILEWKAAVGDVVRRDDTILEISTDKVDSEIPSPATGTLVEVLFEPNSTVDVGVVIARIGTEGEQAGKAAASAPAEAESHEPPAPSPPAGPGSAPELKPPGEPPAGERAPEAELAPTPVDGRSSGRFYSPLVRAIAKREGVSLAELGGIAGSGRKGRVTKVDILAHLEGRKAPPLPAPGAPAPVPAGAAPGGEGLADEVVPMSRIRQRIAQHMLQSLETSAHVYSVADCDMTRAVEARRRHAESFREREGFKLTYTPMIAYASIKAIRDFPLINASLDGENIVKKRNVNLGIAVALPDYSLIVPVVHRTEELNFLGVARGISELAERARLGQLKPEEAAGSTFTITNFGVFGSVIGLPLINQPNVAILGVGAIKKQPVVWESEMGDSIVIRSIMMLTLGHDHRLIDGAYGAQFLQRIIHYLQSLEWEAEF